MLRMRARAPSRPMASNAGYFCCPTFRCYSHSFPDTAVCTMGHYIFGRRNLSNIYTTAPQTINPSFSGHQTFPFRYTWLKKGIDAVTENPTIFSSENASVTLGVGKNMVSSIRHWCRVSGLIEEKIGQRTELDATHLGKTIFGNNNKEGLDPYLEDPATLWLIHYQIATNPDQATSWYWAFNVLRGNQFTPSLFTRDVYKWAQQQQSMRLVSENTLRRDVNCFIRTYCQSRDSDSLVEETFDCPLVELNLIAELPDGAATNSNAATKRRSQLKLLHGR